MMMRKRQIHDGIAGGLITLGVLLGVYIIAGSGFRGSWGPHYCKADSQASAPSITY